MESLEIGRVSKRRAKGETVDYETAKFLSREVRILESCVRRSPAVREIKRFKAKITRAKRGLRSRDKAAQNRHRSLMLIRDPEVKLVMILGREHGKLLFFH